MAGHDEHRTRRRIQHGSCYTPQHAATRRTGAAAAHHNEIGLVLAHRSDDLRRRGANRDNHVRILRAGRKRLMSHPCPGRLDHFALDATARTTG
jgi:hypothetical protein